MILRQATAHRATARALEHTATATAANDTPQRTNTPHNHLRPAPKRRPHNPSSLPISALSATSPHQKRLFHVCGSRSAPRTTREHHRTLSTYHAAHASPARAWSRTASAARPTAALLQSACSPRSRRAAGRPNPPKIRSTTKAWTPSVGSRYTSPHLTSTSGGIGRRAGFRFRYRKVWGFKSLLVHYSESAKQI